MPGARNSLQVSYAGIRGPTPWNIFLCLPSHVIMEQDVRLKSWYSDGSSVWIATIKSNSFTGCTSMLVPSKYLKGRGTEHSGALYHNGVKMSVCVQGIRRGHRNVKVNVISGRQVFLNIFLLCYNIKHQ